MARRTRGPRVAWLPNTNAFSIDVNTTNESVYSTTIHDVSGAIGEHVSSQHGIVIDGEGLDPLAAGVTLADVESSGYRLRRIVGKIWCASRQNPVDGPAASICTAGFIVLRVDPISGAPLAIPDNYYAGSIRQSGDPWIWRRSWIITNSLATFANTGFFASQRIGGASNAGFGGGNLDGPHVDQKTARVVGPEERLFLVLNSTVLEQGEIQEGILQTIKWVWDLRVLGSMRTTSGNRRNSSR